MQRVASGIRPQLALGRSRIGETLLGEMLPFRMLSPIGGSVQLRVPVISAVYLDTVSASPLSSNYLRGSIALLAIRR